MNAVIKVITSLALIVFIPLFIRSQTLSAFKTDKKWGFKQGETVVIEPQYDSVFGFDPTGQVCLVGNVDPLKRSTNSLTHEVKTGYSFYYINPKNQKLFFKAPSALDSSCEATPTKYSGALYLNGGEIMGACINHKKILATKKGKQISPVSYDNIYFTKARGFYIFEIKDSKSALLGLMDAEAKQIIPAAYSKISFNIYDSLIYCCTAGVKFNGSDEIYNFKGEKVHTSSKHIQCAGKNFIVYRLFQSENSYIIHDVKENKEKDIKAEYLYYLKDDKLALLDDEWFFYDLKTDKRTAMDKKLIKYLHLDE